MNPTLLAAILASIAGRVAAFGTFIPQDMPNNGAGLSWKASDEQTFNVIRHTICSYKIMADTGNTSLVFFADAPADGTSNVDQTGKVCSASQAFVLEHVGVTHQYRLDVVSLQNDSGTTICDASELNLVKKYYETGILDLSVQERTVVKHVHDLTNFPPGHGMLAGGVGVGTATTGALIAMFMNGPPSFTRPFGSNPGDIAPRQVINYDKSVKATITWPTIFDIANTAGLYWGVELQGWLITQSN